MIIIDYKHWAWESIKIKAYKNTTKPCNLSKTYVKCSDCEKRATCWDHRDYMRPDDVDPVCAGCNLKRAYAKGLVYLVWRARRGASRAAK